MDLSVASARSRRLTHILEMPHWTPCHVDLQWRICLELSSETKPAYKMRCTHELVMDLYYRVIVAITAIAMTSSFRFPYIHMEAVAAFNVSDSDMKQDEDFQAIRTWQDYVEWKMAYRRGCR
jgi:hypothetical protein